MRAAERCTGVTNAVVGAADGAPVRAERAPPLMGVVDLGGSGSGQRRQGMDGDYHLVVHKGGYNVLNDMAIISSWQPHNQRDRGFLTPR